MSLNKNWFAVYVVLSATICWVGCKPNNNGGATPTGGEPAHHDHDGGDKGHSEESHAEHGHAAEGPHHGQLIELGQDEYHAELTHDEASKSVTIYLLDGGAKNAVPIADSDITLNLVVSGKPQQVKLAAAPQDGDPTGQSSRFSATDEKLLEALEAPTTTGHFNFTIAGKPYTGKIEHHEHGEHKH